MSDCLFCKIIVGEIPTTKVYEDDKCLAFLDIAPDRPPYPFPCSLWQAARKLQLILRQKLHKDTKGGASNLVRRLPFCWIFNGTSRQNRVDYA